MSRLVMKFGGTSVANIERIKSVALRVKREVDSGRQVAVVVSAMSGKTNELVGWCKEISSLHDWREYDLVVSSGELVTSGLLAIALQTLGVPARSWAGWQLPLKTTDMHGSAAIREVATGNLIASLDRGEVAVIAGFQGVASDDRISTLGRGGSDTSAVAVAAALKAERCDIYTDVEGVYTTDPRIVPRAKKIPKIAYEEMLELASVGAKVLQTRSVELAMIHRVPVQVLSSFTDVPGTMVVDEDEIVEKQLVSGIAYSKDEAKLTLIRVPDKPGVAAAIYGPLADGGVNVDMIVQNTSEDGKSTDMTFTVGRAEYDRALHIVEKNKEAIGYSRIATDVNVAKISVVGVGMRTHAGVAALMFRTLAEKGINIQVISTSEIKISVLISGDYTELAVRALHTAYGLDG
jgi:aspartate kinase